MRARRSSAASRSTPAAALELAARAFGGAGEQGEAPLRTALNQYLAALDGDAPEDAAGFVARLRAAFGARQAVLGSWDGKVIATGLVIGALFIPLPDRVRDDAQLEPEGRRFVAASFSAVLRRTLVEPGDKVAAGEALAELEGEALRLSRVAAQARFEEATRKHDAALGEKRLAAAELARAEAEAAEAERDLLDWRIARLALVSPVDGVVIEMPLRDADGAPVREGDVIAEVAPLDRLRVRVDLPIGDLPRLPEAPVAEITFDGGDSGALEVRGLSPASRVEAAEEEGVLPLTATIDNPGGDLRPGQSGVALIRIGFTPLGIIIFSDAWRALERWALR
ncbi:HlyD family efflux transporter periplasmic adaptor subunit [Pikeienuella piscinae]|uniref:HlyD family efflux transporter periplasmic adaptor subunit n=1 Tax=Pikeienuella piscinae TaxID=2748098 RepID=A0A7L5BZV3_9RHOB|nr:HlyD family secretion protein [Pikeienuella piscinae]QIE56047.1 HlyD family efflux transporter periplasmic adaptor subunit [Pikeienuella piscinae]